MDLDRHEFQLDELVQRIKSNDNRLVALQVPEGLKMQALEMMDKIEDDSDAKVIPNSRWTPHSANLHWRGSVGRPHPMGQLTPNMNEQSTCWSPLSWILIAVWKFVRR